MTIILAAVPAQHSNHFPEEDNHDGKDNHDHDDHYEGHDGDADENDDHSDRYKGHGSVPAAPLFLVDSTGDDNYDN